MLPVVIHKLVTHYLSPVVVLHPLPIYLWSIITCGNPLPTLPVVTLYPLPVSCSTYTCGHPLPVVTHYLWSHYPLTVSPSLVTHCMWSLITLDHSGHPLPLHVTCGHPLLWGCYPFHVLSLQACLWLCSRAGPDRRWGPVCLGLQHVWAAGLWLQKQSSHPHTCGEGVGEVSEGG